MYASAINGPCGASISGPGDSWESAATPLSARNLGDCFPRRADLFNSPSGWRNQLVSCMQGLYQNHSWIKARTRCSYPTDAIMILTQILPHGHRFECCFRPPTDLVTWCTYLLIQMTPFTNIAKFAWTRDMWQTAFKKKQKKNPPINTGKMSRQILWLAEGNYPQVARREAHLDALSVIYNRRQSLVHYWHVRYVESSLNVELFPWNVFTFIPPRWVDSQQDGSFMILLKIVSHNAISY